MPSAWNMFVKKIYEEGKSKDSNYEFKQALKDASKRKSEMGHTASVKKHHKRNRTAKRNRSASMAKGRKSRKHRHHKH